MVTIKDGCGCGTASCCSWKDKLEEAYKRATASVNKIGDDAGNVYFPDGTGYVKVPLPTRTQVAQIQTNADDIATLKQRATASEGDIDTLEQDVVRIDTKDTAQDTNIKDNSDRITSTNNDLIATEATVATHDSEIITLKANNEALAKSLVSDVLMTDGTTAGSVQVSIERADGALITSANYRWGRDIGIRLEAGTQAGYVKAVISLSDGTELVSNEYKIVEVLESDVYVTAITLVPDMTAGTIGGNISYSNGTTQTINSVSVPTAPGVTSAIEALQTRMAAVEQKNTTQDSQISAIDARVKAIEDTPGVGQFAAGKLGTIAGSATDGRIKAEDDGTGSVNGWTDLKGRVSTAEGQIVTAQNDIRSLDGTVAQQTTEISGLKTDVTNIQNKNTEQDQSIAGVQTALDGKVNIAQGAENAGKALVVGEDGNVAPAEVSGGKKLYTGTLASLIVNNIEGINIPKEFDIEYIIVGYSSISSSRVTVSPQTLNGGFGTGSLGLTVNLDNDTPSKAKHCFILIPSLDVKIGQGTSTNDAIKLNSMTISPQAPAFYYRLYV